MRVVAVLVAAAGIAPAGALAQGNDPGSGSPSGTIYEIPLDSARADAAPRDSPGSSGTAGASATQATSPSSSIHSENGFGSSTQVPGAPAGSGTGAAKATTADARARRGASATGQGAKRLAAPNGEALIRPAARAAAPSSTRAYVLLVLAAGVAVGLGAAARLAARRR
jgi:hypothetical protein